MISEPAEFDAVAARRIWHSCRARLAVIDWSLVLWILAFKALLLGFGFLSQRTLSDEPITWSEMWNRWDAVHYQALAEFGYSNEGTERFSIVFYPLYPWLVAVVALGLRDLTAASFVVSGVASVAAGLLLQRLVLLDHSIRIARAAVWFLLIFPTSYFLHIGYTESTFLALVLGALVAARQNMWAAAGVLGALASLTRVNGLLLAPVLAIEAWQQYRATRKIDWRWLWIGAVGLGFLGYLALNYHITGDFFAFSRIMEEHWYKKFTWPWIGIRDVWLRSRDTNVTEGFDELLFIGIGLVCTIWCWLRLRPSYAVWMTLNWLLINSTSFVLSVPRYCLTLFPIFILFAQFASKHRLAGLLLSAWSLLFLALFLSKFVHGTWAF